MKRVIKMAGMMAALVSLMLATFSGAVEKPTSSQVTCVTAECHAEYSKQPHVHGPVSLTTTYW